MISFALMLMTLPSRMFEVQAGRADRARHGESGTGRADRVGLPDSSRGHSGIRLDNTSSAARDNATPARTGSYNKER